MTKRYCNICEVELDDYHFWTVTLSYRNDSASSRGDRIARDICDACIAPARELVEAANAT